MKIEVIYFKKERSMNRFVFLLCAAFLTLSSVGHCETDSDKLARLERQLALLSKQAYAKGDAGRGSEQPGSIATTEPTAQAESLEERLQQLLSRIEEVEHENKLLSAQVEGLKAQNTQVAEANLSSKKLEKKNSQALQNMKHKPEVVEKNEMVVITTEEVPMDASAKKSAPTQSSTDAHPEESETQPDASEVARAQAQANAQDALPEGSLQEQYDKAIGMLKAGQYSEASEALQVFLTRYPEHDLAANATYWLGETYFERGEFDKAAVIFAQGYQAYGKGTKGPEMLLKTALCFEKQKKPQEACALLDQLKEAHKVMASGTLQGAQKLKQRLKCT